MLTPVASISYEPTLTSEVPRSLSRMTPWHFLRTHSRSIFQDTERETSDPTEP